MNSQKLDYNYKYDNPIISAKKINKTIFSKDNLPLVRVNIWIPQSKENTFSKGNEKFNSFFDKISNEFINFSNNQLRKLTGENLQINHPYSAVMKYILAYQDDKYISIILDVFFFTEHGRSNTKRMAFNFNRENCDLIISENIINKSDLEKNLSLNFVDSKICKKVIRSYNSSDFYFVPNGVLFFFENNNEFYTYIINKKDYK